MVSVKLLFGIDVHPLQVRAPQVATSITAASVDCTLWSLSAVISVVCIYLRLHSCRQNKAALMYQGQTRTERVLRILCSSFATGDTVCRMGRVTSDCASLLFLGASLRSKWQTLFSSLLEASVTTAVGMKRLKGQGTAYIITPKARLHEHKFAMITLPAPSSSQKMVYFDASIETVPKIMIGFIQDQIRHESMQRTSACYALPFAFVNVTNCNTTETRKESQVMSPSDPHTGQASEDGPSPYTHTCSSSRQLMQGFKVTSSTEVPAQLFSTQFPTQRINRTSTQGSKNGIKLIQPHWRYY